MGRGSRGVCASSRQRTEGGEEDYLTMASLMTIIDKEHNSTESKESVNDKTETEPEVTEKETEDCGEGR